MSKKASILLTLIITSLFVLSVAATGIYRYNNYGVFPEKQPYYSYEGKFNINTATPEMLDLLPGIGTALSNRIVDYRNEHGPYEDVNDLLKVKGIGKGTLNKIIDYISTGDVK